jgi:hypothetical protein
MLFESWYYQIIGLIPQSIAIIALGTALVKEKVKFKKVIFVGFVAALIGFISYQLPLEYGIQLPLGLIYFIIAIRLMLKLSILKSAAAALFAFIILIITEALVVMSQIKFTTLTEEMLSSASDFDRFLIAVPSLLIYVAISLTIYFRANSK